MPDDRPMTFRVTCQNPTCRRRGETELVSVERQGNVYLMPARFLCAGCLMEMVVWNKTLANVLVTERGPAVSIEPDPAVFPVKAKPPVPPKPKPVHPKVVAAGKPLAGGPKRPARPKPLTP